ncbi:hypothetical protein ACEUBN_07740 [Aeromonas veronii]|uniref:hypothetical protein n=1 Tax=Aeromonas TaxID=642 RepID=UPI001BCBAB55|nr:hypothetical protein [Aeromonas veronii]MBS4726787.1 hypothetical protein [Aeromonas veronii]BEE18863.1 hypothetical protein VAWG006_31160 [Aeromonas enteropelogenes]BEE23026.1 hypothetical protein VAWG007_31210 [Aeromonas enteropelogenes]
MITPSKSIKEKLLNINIDAALDALGSALCHILDNFLVEPKNLDEIINAQSTLVDKYILKVEAEERVQFIGGKLNIKDQKDENIAFLIELYFKNNKDEWIKKENTIFINKEKIKEESIISMQNGVVSYDISHPNK